MRISDWSSDVCSSDLLPKTDPDCVRPVDRLRRLVLLSLLLLIQRRGARLMSDGADLVPGYCAPVHRSLSEPILLGGAPRAVAILNGTLAGAICLGLRPWLAGVGILAIVHAPGVWAARREPPGHAVGGEKVV